MGLGFQYGVIFPDHLPDWSQGVFDNGMASGGIVAMVLSLLTSLRKGGEHVFMEPTVGSLSKLRAALDLAGEEAFLYLLEHRAESEPQPVLLRHVAQDVRHEQFYDMDVLTVTVDSRPLV